MGFVQHEDTVNKAEGQDFRNGLTDTRISVFLSSRNTIILNLPLDYYCLHPLRKLWKLKKAQ